MILTIGMEHAMESINGTARMNSIIVLDFADSASYCSQKDIGVKQLIKEKGGGERGTIAKHNLCSGKTERNAEIHLVQGEEINAFHSSFCLESEYLLALASLVITITGNILKI
ncbi:hypothetical protein HGM15179_006900 [Zosterops borbonicus]|uniref:Uncharacterized protein n=1 Tax=Zosterops borbonicus TaxID=364589 RepID=A0A8K1LN92_9PASS|nr:hypothetical protein HGM15179_006900 [Zosterops borbonicus]